MPKKIIVILIVSIIAVVGIAVFLNKSKPPKPKDTVVEAPITLENLLKDNAKASELELTELNLLCADGLPNSENLDIEQYQKKVEEWASLVGTETFKYLPQFKQNPQNFNNSEAYFKVLTLITVLEQDLKIKYNPALMSDTSAKSLNSTAFFKDSRDLFINGVIDKRLGTCVSLPVLITAVGRELGYPLKLVPSKAHLFVRWEDNNERFNIESGGNGLKTYPDSYYKSWPFPLTKQEMESGFFLKSLTPEEELGIFLETRALCLMENNRLDEAQTAFKKVLELIPNHPHIRNYIKTDHKLARK